MVREAGNNFWYAVLKQAKPGDALIKKLNEEPQSLPTLLALSDQIPAGPRPYHYHSLLKHLARCMNEVAGDPLAVWLAMAHDAGKTVTPPELWPHHYGHEESGAKIAGQWGLELQLPQLFVNGGILAARWHMRAGRYPILRPGKKCDLLVEVENSGCGPAFWKMVDADKGSNISLQAQEDWRLISSIEPQGLAPERLRQLRIALLTKTGSQTQVTNADLIKR